MRHRRLEFHDTPQDKEAFGFIYQGFLNGGNGAQAKGMEVMRREATILDKLDEHSVEDETGARVLRGPAVVLLTQPEYELLKKYFENTPWTTKVSRRVVGISDWLAAIPLEETDG